MAHVFFDLDETLITTQSQRLFLDLIYKHKYISFFQLIKLKIFFIGYKLHLLPKKNVENTYYQVARWFKGVSVQEIYKLTREFVFYNFPKIINLKVVEELKHHLSVGREVTLSSASFEPMVQSASEFFHINDYLCTKLNIVQDRYTGELNGLPNYGIQKIRNISTLDLKGSFAYADHYSDIPLLSKVDYPYVVKPDRKLRRYALKHGWGIID